MKKELLTVEFRFRDARKDETEYRTEVVTIGIYETLEEAITEGNRVLSELSKHFKIKSDDRFVKNHLWGMPKRLVVDSSYNIFAKIEQLDFTDISETVKEVFAANARYRDYKNKAQID